MMNPPFPPSFDVDVEAFRKLIVSERLPWFDPIILRLMILEIVRNR